MTLTGNTSLPKIMEVDYISLDHSGTISNDIARVVDAYNGIFRHKGMPEISISDFRHEFEIPFERFCIKRGVDITREEVNKMFRTFYDQSKISVAPFVGVKETLRFLKEEQQKRMTIISSHLQDYLEKEIEAYGIRKYFDEIRGSALDKKVVMKELIEKHGLEPGRVLHVDDMEYGINDAKDLGIKTVAVTCGYRNFYTLSQANPDFIFPDFRSLWTQWHNNFK